MTIINYLIVLMASGMSIDDALWVLCEHHPRYRVNLMRVRRQLKQGASVSKITASFFPWWCEYPYQPDVGLIDTRLFFVSCHDYIHARLTMLQSTLSRMLYPIILFFFSILMVIVSSMMVMSTSSTMVVSQMILTGGGLVLLGLGGAFLWMTMTQIMVGPYDILVLVELGFSQGWSLRLILSSLSLPSRHQVNWSNVLTLSLNNQSFIQAFCHVYNVPGPINQALSMHEVSGQLHEGLKTILPLYREYNMKKIKWVCHYFKSLVYVFVVMVIFCMIYFVYIPMMMFID